MHGDTFRAGATASAAVEKHEVPNRDCGGKPVLKLFMEFQKNRKNFRLRMANRLSRQKLMFLYVFLAR